MPDSTFVTYFCLLKFYFLNKRIKKGIIKYFVVIQNDDLFSIIMNLLNTMVHNKILY